MTQKPQLPADVQQALERGNLIEAIKLLRDKTGLGLAEAKHAVESFGNGVPVALPPARPSGRFDQAGMPAEAAAALQRGNKIEAIRVYREHMQTGLKEAKEAVEAYEARTPGVARPGLAPGEVPPSATGKWWALAVGALVLVLVGMLARRMF